MNSETLGPALKEMAERWDAPCFAPEVLAQQSQARTLRRRHRVLAAAGITAVLGTGAITGVVLTASGGAAPTASDGEHRPTRHTTVQNNSMRPAILPPVRVRAIGATGEHLHGVPVLAHLREGTAITVHAKLWFIASRPAKVQQAALIVARPGTTAGVGGGRAVDAYYKDAEVAKGRFVTATSPEHRTLAVTTPADLPPGQYPVLYVLGSALTPGQQPGVYGPFDMSGQLGVVIVGRK